jgi:NB-ARC domain-containing protein
MPNEILSALKRLLADVATEDDRKNLQQALLNGKIAYVSGERAVAIGGDATGNIIIAGDIFMTGTGNQIGFGNQGQIAFDLSRSDFDRLRNELLPAPKGCPPAFPPVIFLGRESALQKLKSLLLVADGSAPHPKQAIVRGWPGVGKTTLVSAIARDPDVIRVYPDGVLWTSLDKRPAIMSILAAWGRALGKDDLLRIATVEEAVTELHTRLQRERMLLIVDDVWEEGHGALFQKIRGGNCGLLITTRLDKVAESLAQTGSEIYNLPVLAEEDALKLMLLLAPMIVERYPEECRDLIRDLEYLPLALHVAARLLRKRFKRGLGVTALLEEIRNGAAVIEAAAPSDRAVEGYLPTVKALLQRSTDMLGERTRNCFAFLGAFAPKPATFDLAAMKAVWNIDDPVFVAEELMDYGLLEPVGDGRFQMHSLLVAHAISLWGD